MRGGMHRAAVGYHYFLQFLLLQLFLRDVSLDRSYGLLFIEGKTMCYVSDPWLLSAKSLACINPNRLNINKR